MTNKVAATVTTTSSPASLYLDAMDPSRFLSPIESGKKQIKCRVYWDTRKKPDGLPGKDDLMYGGTAVLPARLFFDTSDEGRHLPFIGFKRVK